MQEQDILDEALSSENPCILSFGSWNDAVSMKARLERYIRAIGLTMGERSPFNSITIKVVKPDLLVLSKKPSYSVITFPGLPPEA